MNAWLVLLRGAVAVEVDGVNADGTNAAADALKLADPVLRPVLWFCDPAFRLKLLNKFGVRISSYLKWQKASGGHSLTKEGTYAESDLRFESRGVPEEP